VIDPVLSYSTYLGGGSDDRGYGITVDSSGSAYVTGYTYSADFPTANPLQASTGMSSDAFITKLNTSGSAFVYSTYLGGNNSDDGMGIAADSSGNSYVTGRTLSTDFPTAHPLQTSSRGDYDGFVTKIGLPTYSGITLGDVTATAKRTLACGGQAAVFGIFFAAVRRAHIHPLNGA